MSLLNMVTGMMSTGMVSKVASLVGIESGLAKTALNAVMPNILRGITSMGATEKGAGSLLNMIKNNGLGGKMDLNADMLKSGGKLNESLFGDKLKDIKVPGLSGDKRASLMNAATPLALGSLGKVVNDKNLDAKGLSAYLRDNSDTAAATTHRATDTTRTASRAAAAPAKSGGGGILKFLLPLLLLGAAAYFWMTRDGGTIDKAEKAATTNTATTTNGTTTSATHTHADGTVHAGHSHGSAGAQARDAVAGAADLAKGAAGKVTSTAAGAAGAVGTMAGTAKGLSLDADGNLLKDGKMFLKKGEFTVKDGEYFDKEGKSLGFLAKIGKAIGDAGKAVGGAVAGAAGKTADFFKDSFGGMFKQKKAGGTVAAYSLNQIQFDADGYKIKSFSKNEVEGLAAALQAYPDAKITVQGTGGDKKLSGKRAQVIHDMLVALGVSDGQIKAKGMGEGAEKFEIIID